MKITADTNVLLRLLLADDEDQSLSAVNAMENASHVVISVHSLCELAWVLDRLYQKTRTEIASAIQGLIETKNVIVNRPAVEAGLAILKAEGDFADGIISFDGRCHGGETFVSFDKRAVKLLKDQGAAAVLLK